MIARLRELYEKDLKGQLMKELSLNNINQVPRLEKIVLNMGLGEAASDRGKIEGAMKDLSQISGQKAVTTKAKKSVASFKLREGMIYTVEPGIYFHDYLIEDSKNVNKLEDFRSLFVCLPLWPNETI